MPVVLPSGLALSVRSARVVAIIPARFSSTRLPGKPLALIGGRTMIEHVHERASQAASIDAVLIATDDDRIARTVSDFGGTAVMTSPEHRTGTDRLAEVAAHLDSEIVVNVQGDEPFMTPGAIDAVAALLAGRPADRMATLRRRVSDPLEFLSSALVKVVVDRDGYALYFSRAPIPFTRPDLPAAPMWQHLGLYAYRREFLLQLAGLPSTPLEQAEGLEQLRVLEHGFRIATVETTAETLGVDTPEDLEKARRLIEAGVHR